MAAVTPDDAQPDGTPEVPPVECELNPDPDTDQVDQIVEFIRRQKDITS